MTKYIDRYYLNWELYGIKFGWWGGWWGRDTITWFSYASKTLSTPSNVYGDQNVIAFGNDGTKLYIAWEDTNTVYQWTLSTAWDISTGTYDNKDMATGLNVTTSITFSADWLTMWVWWGRPTAYLYKYELSTAWDVSTANYVWDSTWKSNVWFANCTWIYMSVDGNYVFALSRENYWIRRYTMSTPFDITTMDSLDYQSYTTTGYNHSIQLNPQWTQLFYIDRTNRKIHICDLSTPFDLTTLVETSQYSVPTPSDNNITEIHIDNWWNSMYLWWYELDYIYQYDTITS